jgi:hypothetical protein
MALEVLAGLHEGDLGYAPLVFEEAGERVAVARPRVRATARRLAVSFIVCYLVGSVEALKRYGFQWVT